MPWYSTKRAQHWLNEGAIPLSFRQNNFVIRRALLLAIAAGMISHNFPASAAETTGSTLSESDPMLFIDSKAWTVRGHFQLGVNAVAERNLFWDLGESATGNTEFNADKEWLEFYAEPGISFERHLASGSAWFGKVSAVGSYTAGTDAFDASNIGSVTAEEVYLGYRTKFAGDWDIEVSLGPRVLKLGTGMLIANGGSDGFERGALKLGPREAWEKAAIVQLTGGGFKTTAFYMAPNEMPSNDTKNLLNGVDLRWDGKHGDYSGLTYIHVLKSEAAYPKAAPGGVGAPTIIPDARAKLNALNFYGKMDGLSGALSNLSLALDIAYEWNDRIDLRAWGGRVKLEYAFTSQPWQPTLGYSFQTFSGDDPDTTRIERFDPLYYDGSPSTWATGSKSAMVFINSNVLSHNLSLRVTPTVRDTVTLRYSHVRANELRSPLQFGQATRLDFSDGLSTVVSGVTNAHLSDDVFIEYNRIVTPNIYLTAGLSISIPGAGIISAAGGNAPDWKGGFINVVFNY
ncbi:hypothetical protein GCM10007978_45080 [Shewanella hanedai]|nr:alginate export family protein [Shewanella hanedai]GGJ02567.1 hypothetical protein GCM10007978_45080 [Shewanella hanedai]